MRNKGQDNDQSLYDEIAKFRRRRWWWAFLLVLVAATGLVIPIVPGALLLLFALALIRPGLMAKLRRYFGIKSS